MTNQENSSAPLEAKSFHEPRSTLELASDTWPGSDINSSSTTLASTQLQGSKPRGRSRLIMDSDDDMDEDENDDELLTMPMGSQKMELQIDQSFMAPPASHAETISSDTHSALAVTKQVVAARATTLLPEIVPRPQTATVDDDDGLFGDDFMAEFGSEADLDFEASQNKKPLFHRRIPLLEASEDPQDGDPHDDLGLERLSITQKHRTISGAPVPTEVTRSTHTGTSSTTIISSAATRLTKMYNRPMNVRNASLDPASSQLEDELLEMSARQHDALLDDMSLEDERIMEEEMGLQQILLLQTQELEQLEEQHSQQDARWDTGMSDSHKRKLPVSTEQDSTSHMTTLDELDRFLDESSAVGNSSLQRAVDASKKTRLDGRGADKRPLTRTAKAPEIPKHDYTLPPETGPFIRAKSNSGTTFYLAKKVRVDHNKNSFLQQQLLSGEHSRKPLLSTTIHRMMDDLDAELRVQKQEAINRLEYEGPEDVSIGEDATNDASEKLWVDKYRPKKYTDLMGDERVNREVLSWIKEWDQCVFGRKYKKFTSDQKKQQYKEFKDFRKPDPLGRPDRKVLLLTGPPGLGKTTMAHVIAKQAGYNVIEVNASDDRTGASVKGKIEAALENQSILGSDKPNLLIIDEIDGVSSSGGEQSFIKLLVDMASVEVASSEDKGKTSGGSKKKKFTKKPLMRPIICICNDQYAPVLRPLRVIAQIYQFKKPSVRTVVNRLQQVCETEQVPSDTRAFGVLYEMTEGDMRSCLNTLQFIKNKSKTSVMQASVATSSAGRIGAGSGNGSGEGLTMEALTKATIGRKDQSKSLFSVWEELFQAPYARKSRSALKVMEEGREGLVKDDSNTYVSRMVSLIHTNGEYDKLVQGCFENYPSMVFHDVAMSKVVECGDWLAFYDQLNARVSSNFEYESFVAHKANESILQGMTLNLPPKAQRHFRKSNFATELLSPFLRILSPHMRPVNKQLIKPEERAVLKRLVDIMIQFQLTFVQEKTEDGQFLYRLEPSIEKLGDFSTIGLKNVLTNRYAVRQLIAQEIEVEMVRRAEAVKESKLGAFFGGSKDASMKGASLETSASLSASMDVDGEKLAREAVDFFGRVIVQPQAAGSSLDGSMMTGLDAGGTGRPKKKTRIWYKFNEGFSNAVKAKVFIHELL
ncbi:hypothetical protein BGZ70_003817 [Mortierella alpina]|uniref:AAA+ ATPase domain-containing protein n=1 Tax=Mortierella alpina TaxID=64518 RepID=A0A9P6M520_MORAP|nr:hypothetical protein BGZ70_003817 [Mortierella alpina]